MTENTHKLPGKDMPELTRFEDKPKSPFANQMLLVTTAMSGAMLGAATYHLVDVETAIDAVKALVIAASGTCVAYAVGKLAIEKGAPLSAINFPGAKAVSTLSILAVGAGLFASTYSGLTISKVDELRLSRFGTELSEFIDAQDELASRAGRTGPALKAVVSDLQQKTACELANSCISLRGNGGRGTVTKMLENKTARAEGILAEFESGQAVRTLASSQITKLMSEYDTTLENSDLSLKQRRKSLRQIVGKIRRALNMLKEALPISLLEAYANELQEGVEIAGRPVATQNLNGVFRAHGNALAEVIESLEAKDLIAPVFPAKTGVTQTFGFIGHFLPIAAIIAVLELVFPITIWLYTYFTLYCRLDGITPSKLTEEDDEKGRNLDLREADEALEGNVVDPSKLNGRRPRGRPRIRPAAE
ncbi:hypothetical protein [Roseibium sp. MB-4]